MNKRIGDWVKWLSDDEEQWFNGRVIAIVDLERDSTVIEYGIALDVTGTVVFVSAYRVLPV